MRSTPFTPIAAGVVLLTFVALVIAFNAINLVEAYGSGPPYYARTTNMDKWQSPGPLLAPLDGLTAALSTLYLIWTRKRHRSSQAAPARASSPLNTRSPGEN